MSADALLFPGFTPHRVTTLTIDTATHIELASGALAVGTMRKAAMSLVTLRALCTSQPTRSMVASGAMARPV